MTFSAKVKTELCEPRVEKKCCAVAEAYGVLLYCNNFSPKEIRITTANDDLIKRLPRLFKRAFGISFDILPDENASGKRSLLINDPQKLSVIYNVFGNDPSDPSLHINFAVIEEPCCKASFVRGAFLAGGSITDPDKSFHLELSTPHHSVSREAFSVLLELNLSPKESERKGNYLLYFKQSEYIGDFLTTIGASTAAMDIINSKVEREMRNSINRLINCDTANADKVVTAAQEQLSAIKLIEKKYGIGSLPEKLQEAALLRIANPEASLSDLAQLSYPPVTKSCLNHRLKKLMNYKPEGE